MGIELQAGGTHAPGHYFYGAYQVGSGKKRAIVKDAFSLNVLLATGCCSKKSTLIKSGIKVHK
jgi:hypothetical protein